MNGDIATDPERHAEEDLAEPTRHWGPHARFVLRILGILLAGALILILLGLLFPPSYWRF